MNRPFRGNFLSLVGCTVMASASLQCAPATTNEAPGGSGMSSGGSASSGNSGGSNTGGSLVSPGAGGNGAGDGVDPYGEWPATGLFDPELDYPPYTPNPTDRMISRARYFEHVQGFWLGENIANWSGLITEFDKDGSPATLPFYTDDDWGGPDQPSIWGHYGPSPTHTIEYIFVPHGEVWGADDDTDIEYMYQHLLDQHDVSVLSPEQIRDGWLLHIYSNEDGPAPSDDPTKERENYLWVSNERAYYLMKDDGLLPPATSEPANNPDYSMIDAQLTTEIFGLFAPTRPDFALQMAHLPIRTTAKDDAQWAAEFYVTMYSLAAAVDPALSMKDQVFWLAEQARQKLPSGSYVAAMYDFVKASYEQNTDKSDWESTRDAIYQRYQLGAGGMTDGYVYREGFDAGINFASSLVSLFYGEGDLPRTVRIGSLAGWDSDNPTATWGGLLGLMLGKRGVEAAFGRTDLSEAYSIHRTRRNFPDHTPGEPGEDTFSLLAERALYIIDRVVMDELGGGVDLENGRWYVPAP